MPVEPLPDPPIYWSKWAVYLDPMPPLTFLHGLLDYFGHMQPAGDPDFSEWRRLVITFSDTVSADVRDDAVITFDLMNQTGTAIDGTWTNQDYLNVENTLDSFFVTNAAFHTSTATVSAYTWYRRAFNPYGDAKAFADGGPPVRQTLKNHAGVSTSHFPPQCSLHIQEHSPWPRHQGRFYPPFIPGTFIASSRRPSNQYVDDLATGWQGVYEAWMGAAILPCIPVTKAKGNDLRALLGISGLRVDNSYDVIRRRHHEDPTYTKVVP